MDRTHEKFTFLQRFDTGARLVGVAALLLLLGSVGQLAYRFTLPTEGWSGYTEEIADSNWLLDRNLVGAPSELRPGDALLAVDGVSVAGMASSGWTTPPPTWQAGHTVTMEVKRGSEELSLPVSVMHWTTTALFRHNFLESAQFGATLGALLLLGMGWFTFLRRPEVLSARALLILSTAVGAQFVSGMLPDGLSVQFDRPAFAVTSFYSYMIFGTVLAPALLTFTLLFPQPKRMIGRRLWLALLPYGYGALLFLLLVGGVPGEIGWYSTLGMFGLSILSFVHAGRTQRDAVSRAQLRWALSGFVLGIGLFMLNFPVAFNWITNLTLIELFNVAQSFGFAIMGTGLAIAVLRYRLYDIDVIIRKTLGYAVLSLLLALVYFGMVVLLQGMFESLSGEQSPIAVVISTLVIAALFSPLRRRVQLAIDRRFFRQRFDAQLVLAQFSQTARNEVSLQALIGELTHVVQETLQPERVTVWFKKTGR